MPRGTLILQVTGLGHSLGQPVKFRPKNGPVGYPTIGSNPASCDTGLGIAGYDIKGRVGSAGTSDYGQPATLQNVAHRLFAAKVRNRWGGNLCVFGRMSPNSLQLGRTKQKSANLCD
jgi:hypothetical protein